MDIKRKLSPPDAVRVWRGFKSPNLSQHDFFERLSTVFVPATVEMQTRIGLDVYIPTIPGGLPDKPVTVPDETAILFWNSQETYHDGFKTLAVRTYTLTHGAVYTSESRADFPLFFNGELAVNQPYYLIDKPADWMTGKVQHLVAQMNGKNVQDELHGLISQLQLIQKSNQLDGAVVCRGPDYIVFWTLNDSGKSIDKLRSYIQWNITRKCNPYTLPKGLWDQWPGMDISPGDSFNMQFERPPV